MNHDDFLLTFIIIRIVKTHQNYCLDEKHLIKNGLNTSTTHHESQNKTINFKDINPKINPKLFELNPDGNIKNP